MRHRTQVLYYRDYSIQIIQVKLFPLIMYYDLRFFPELILYCLNKRRLYHWMDTHTHL
jgi:hypothetical protein